MEPPVGYLSYIIGFLTRIREPDRGQCQAGSLTGAVASKRVTEALKGLLKFPTPATDRDRTVSRRSEPSSRTTLMGEQPNPWDLLQPQDVMSRHRGAKPPRRCGLLGEISLLSPG